jgi:hypothetical protein
MSEASLRNLQVFKGGERSSGPDGMTQPNALYFSAQLIDYFDAPSPEEVSSSGIIANTDKTRGADRAEQV